MNLALGSLILIFLLIPGIAFRIALIKSDSFENPLDTSLRAEIGLILVSSALIHILGTATLSHFGITTDIKSLYGAIIGDSSLIDWINFKNSYKNYFLYSICCTVFWYIVGLLIKYVFVRKFWDVKYSFIPMTNEWDAILSGRLFLSERKSILKSELKELKCELKELYPAFYIRFWNWIKKMYCSKTETNEKEQAIAEFKKEIQSIENKIHAKIMSNFAKVDLVVETKDCDLIYRGKVHKYFLSKNNNLDKLILKEVRRKKIDALEFKEFNSQYFVIQYDKIKNMNITFQFLAKDGTVITE